MEIKEMLGELSILLIEDNPGDQKLIKEYLQESNQQKFKIENSFCLEEGISLLKSKKYDTVILDLGLPDSSGISSLKSIKEINDSVPVIVFTVDKSEETGLEAIKYGAQDYLVKDDLPQINLSKSIKFAISRKKLELELKNSLKEKELLIKESHHRIKNNLQLVTSLINFSLSRTEDSTIQNILNDCLNRVASISTLHNYIYSSSELNEVNVQIYLYKLIDYIRTSLLAIRNNIKIVKKIENIVIDSAMAISLGLLVNELVTNAVKYAFEGKDGVIEIEIKREGNNIILTVKDNGRGMDQDINVTESKTLGFQIINSIINQYNGEIHYSVKEGTEFKIKLELIQNLLQPENSHPSNIPSPSST
jgi:two-component sensor histidine kinase